MTKLRFLTPSILTIAIAAFSLVGALVAQAATVRVFVLAPNGTTSLNYVETTGVTPPAFQQDFNIPYDTLASQLTAAANSKLATLAKSGTETCYIPGPFLVDICPDIDWKVTFKADITFPVQALPVITAFGDPALNGIDISTKPRMKVHLDVAVTVNSEPFNFPVDILVDINVSGKLNLWPEVKAPGVPCPSSLKPVCITLTPLPTTPELAGLDELFTAAGAAAGAFVGFTPLGLGLGGPGPLSTLGAVLGGTVAADAARKAITDAINNAIKKHLPALQTAVNSELEKQINLAIPQANKLRDQLLNTKLPGVGKSYQELSSAFGLTLDVETTTSSGNVNVIVTPRLAAAAGTGKFAGKVRFPKEACAYITHPLLGTLPMGLHKTNEDLAAKVGAACSSILQVAGLKVSGYLGASPIVVQGAGANALPTWKSMGSVNFTGNLTSVGSGRRASLFQGSGYYECGFEISGLPNADIVELIFLGPIADRLVGYQSKFRYLEVSALGQKIVLDSSWKKIAAGPQSLIFGGVGGCGSGSTGGAGLMTNLGERLKDKFDPEKCPQCGIRLNGRILEITNPDPILKNPTLKSAFESLELERAAVRKNIGGQQKLPQDLTVQPKLVPR